MGENKITKKDNRIYCEFYNMHYKKEKNKWENILIEEFMIYSIDENRILSLEQALAEYFIEDPSLENNFDDLGIVKGKIIEDEYYEKKFYIFKDTKVSFINKEFRLVLNLEKFIPIKVLSALEISNSNKTMQYINSYYIDSTLFVNSRYLGVLVNHLTGIIDSKTDMVICLPFCINKKGYNGN